MPLSVLDRLVKRVKPVNAYTVLSLIGEPHSLNEPRRWEIPAGMVFVCGDYRAASEDSRYWGPIPLRVITGVVIHQFKRHAP